MSLKEASRFSPQVESVVRRLSLAILPDVSPDYLSSLQQLYQSKRTLILMDKGRRLVIKERLHSFSVSEVPLDEIKSIASRQLKIEEEEACFFSQAFPKHTPAFSVTTGTGSQGVPTVFVIQEYVPGLPLGQVEDLDLNNPSIREFWEQVLHVLDYEHRLPDLQADLPIDLLLDTKNLPDPFRTSNVILTHDSGCMLVDMEEQLGHWSRKTSYGRYVICPLIKRLIINELSQQSKITTRVVRMIRGRARRSREER